MQRKRLGDVDSGITISTQTQHVPDVIESQLSELLPSNRGVKEIICVDCTKLCTHQPAIHIYIYIYTEIHKEELQDVNSYTTLITRFLNRKHSVTCAEISFFEIGKIPYFDCDGAKVRFQMRDEHINGKLSKHCLFNWTNSETENEEIENEPHSVKCQECFGDIMLKPLSIYFLI